MVKTLTTRTYREELKARIAAATKGPWCITYDGDHYSWTQDDGRLDIFQCGDKNRRGNVAFTRHARTDVELLLSQLERAEAALEFYREHAMGAGIRTSEGMNDDGFKAHQALASLRAVLDAEEK